MSEKVETGDAHSSKHVEFHEKTEKVSMWDFVHFNQSAELQSYMNSLAEAEEKVFFTRRKREEFMNGF